MLLTRARAGAAGAHLVLVAGRGRSRGGGRRTRRGLARDLGARPGRPRAGGRAPSRLTADEQRGALARPRALGAAGGWVAAEPATVEPRVEDGGPDGAVVRSDGDVAARWVVDTRPVAPARPGRVRLLQHFRGWFVRTATDGFDPAVAG